MSTIAMDDDHLFGAGGDDTIFATIDAASPVPATASAAACCTEIWTVVTRSSSRCWVTWAISATARSSAVSRAIAETSARSPFDFAAASTAAWAFVHKWWSLICTLFLLMLCITGLPLIFHEEIDALTVDPLQLAKNAPPSSHGGLPLDVMVKKATDARPGEVPVFWACGVTPQAAIMESRPPFAVTHAPGYMFITDVPDTHWQV